ncbi:MAG: hypothetical protein Q7T76_07335 [Ferruginibacter sp.]|nr:hypothetical protein [Ferruginibacter sp.]
MRKNRVIILILLLTLVAIALVIWAFDKKLRRLEVKQKTTAFLLLNQPPESLKVFHQP